MTAVERVAALRQAARDSGARPAVRAVPLRTGGKAGIPDTDRPARAAVFLAMRCRDCDGDFVPQRPMQHVCGTCKPATVAA